MSDPAASDRTPRLAVYAGVFDPPTMAHLEIIESALRIFDELVVVVSFNPNKASALFSPEERVEMIDASLTEPCDHACGSPPTRADRAVCRKPRRLRARPRNAPVRRRRPRNWAGADEPGAGAAPADGAAFASAKYVYLSSSFVRETATLGGMIVPGSVSPPVEEALRKRFGRQLSNGDGATSKPPAPSNTTSGP